MNLISAQPSQPSPAGLLNSTEDFSAIPDMISFFYLSCKLFHLLKAIWPVVNARSKQATRRHHLDRQTRSGSRQYTPTQKKTRIFGAIFNQISLPDIASCGCMTLFWAPVPFPTKLWVRCWQERWLPGFYFTKRRQSSQLSWQFVNISVCRWHGEE